MDVVMSGARGLIGSALRHSLELDGHRVIPLLRPGTAGDGIHWDPASGTIDDVALEGIDAVVHLAGEGVASHRWTEEHKRRVRDSRVDGTTVLATALARLQRKPKVFVSGSAIGYYGDRELTELTEESGPGVDFLSEVCQAWEAATGPAQEAGIRTVHIRTGVVLSLDGGALQKQLPVFRFGLGGQAGSGQQWLSWITLADEIGAIRFSSIGPTSMVRRTSRRLRRARTPRSPRLSPRRCIARPCCEFRGSSLVCRLAWATWPSRCCSVAPASCRLPCSTPATRSSTPRSTKRWKLCSGRLPPSPSVAGP